jgi:hypothetical protein
MSGAAPRTIVFLGKAGDHLCAQAAAHLVERVPTAQVWCGTRGDPCPLTEPGSPVEYLMSVFPDVKEPQEQQCFAIK